MSTYDHRLKRTGHPVRSAIHKLQIGRLVVGWVTTSEYLLLYVFVFFVFFVSFVPFVPFVLKSFGIRTILRLGKYIYIYIWVELRLGHVET